MTVTGLVLTTLAVCFITMTTGSGPQSKVMVPPAATASTTAADVQEPASRCRRRGAPSWRWVAASTGAATMLADQQRQRDGPHQSDSPAAGSDGASEPRGERPSRVPRRIGRGQGVLFLVRGLEQAEHGGDRQGHDDDAEAEQRGHLPVDHPALVQGVDDQLDADPGQDERQTQREVDQPAQQSAEQEVELAQAHEREDVGGEHQVGLLGDAEDRRDRVEGEDDVGHAERHDDDQHRREDPDAVLLPPQRQAAVVLGDVETRLGELHQPVVLRVLLLVVAVAAHEGPTAV